MIQAHEMRYIWHMTCDDDANDDVNWRFFGVYLNMSNRIWVEMVSRNFVIKNSQLICSYQTEHVWCFIYSVPLNIYHICTYASTYATSQKEKTFLLLFNVLATLTKTWKVNKILLISQTQEQVYYNQLEKSANHLCLAMCIWLFVYLFIMLRHY